MSTAALPSEVLGKVASHLSKKQRLSVFSTDTCAYAEVEMEAVLAELQPVTAQIRKITTVLNQHLKGRNQFNAWDEQAQTPNILFSEWPRQWTDDDVVPQSSINRDLVDGLRDGLRDGGIVCSWIKQTDLSNEIRIPLYTSQACTYTMYVREHHFVSGYDKNTENRWLEFRMTYTDCTECWVRIEMEEEELHSEEYSLSIFLGPQVLQKTSPGHADACRLWNSRTRDVAAFVTAILRAQQEPYLLLHLSSYPLHVPSIAHMCLEMCGQYGLVQRAN
jgi:hypothetical protein